MVYVHRYSRDVSVINDALPVPGVGFLAINAFVIHSREPVVVDTGVSLADRDFLNTLGSVMDPADVRWIWLTHPDRDHTGGLFELLDAAPNARVVTTFLGVGIMSTSQPLPLDRVYLLNPGQSLDVGDRKLHAFRPPLFDSPATVGFYDDRSAACFSSDCFGAPMSTAGLATADDVREVPSEDLRAGQLLWAAIDSPWVHVVDRWRFAASLEPLRTLDPSVVLSSHLPPAPGRAAELLDNAASAPDADRFIGPDQRGLEELLASFEPTTEPQPTARTEPAAHLEVPTHLEPATNLEPSADPLLGRPRA